MPPTNDEVAAGAIGRNFISRDLLETISLENAILVRPCNNVFYYSCSSLPEQFRNITHWIGFSLQRIRSAEVSVGHSYNLIDVQTRRIVNVETASRFRFSAKEIGATPFFHANMYTHLQINQVIIRKIHI